MKNAIFWDVTQCSSCKNRRFELLRSVSRMLVTANVPSSLILVTLMMEAIRSSETSVLTRATDPRDGILDSRRRENLKSYVALTGWAL
jgi:hypothetical protein